MIDMKLVNGLQVTVEIFLRSHLNWVTEFKVRSAIGKAWKVLFITLRKA